MNLNRRVWRARLVERIVCSRNESMGWKSIVGTEGSILTSSIEVAKDLVYLAAKSTMMKFAV